MHREMADWRDEASGHLSLQQHGGQVRIWEDGTMERVSDLKCPGKDILMEEPGTRYNHFKAFQAGTRGV